MSDPRHMMIVRMNPQAPGSIAAGMTQAEIARTIWLPLKEFATPAIRPGSSVLVRVAGPGAEGGPPAREIMFTAVAAPPGDLAAGTALMAAGDRAALLVGSDTAGSGTPTLKGVWIELFPAPTTAVEPSGAKPSTTEEVRAEPAAAAGAERLIDDAICTACGCICDDIQLTIADDRIGRAEHACEIGREWFLDESRRLSAAATTDGADCWIEGESATIEAGLQRAADLLLAADNPLVYGLSETTCEAQRAAVEIADLLRANLDTTTSTFHGPTVMALQAVGESTCTLGEIRDRADLVMLWGVNPLETDPRHYSRYSLLPTGRFVPRGRADRYCVVVDIRHTPTADVADLALRIKPSSDFEALWTLRALAAEQELDPVAVVAATGVELAVWQALFERMRQARYGVILYGTGVTQTRGKHLNCEALMTLVTEMNRHTRFACKAMRGAGNVTGGDNVLTWRTGYPFGVNFSRGYPRYNPGEYTAADLLARGEVDAALVVASDPSATFGPAALDHLRSIPTVVIDARSTAIRQRATVAFATAPYGLSTGGTVYRMDEIPLALRPAIVSRRSSELEILERLTALLRGRR